MMMMADKNMELWTNALRDATCWPSLMDEIDRCYVSLRKAEHSGDSARISECTRNLLAAHRVAGAIAWSDDLKRGIVERSLSTCSYLILDHFPELFSRIMLVPVQKLNEDDWNFFRQLNLAGKRTQTPEKPPLIPRLGILWWGNAISPALADARLHSGISDPDYDDENYARSLKLRHTGK